MKAKQAECVLIYGAGGFARELAAWMTLAKIHVIGFFSDDQKAPESLMGIPVFKELKHIPRCKAFVGIGDPKTRQKIFSLLLSEGFDLSDSFYAPGSVVGYLNIVHQGSVVCPNAVITVNCTIGVSALLNLGVTIGHDCKIGDFVTFSPGANVSGNATIGDYAYIGSNAVIREKINIGAGAIIGAGAVITKDVMPGEVIVGNPGRPMRIFDPNTPVIRPIR
jgi:sugar O-acyltransferase (sialic acid O-acetyltransferase NeuD family)